MIDKENLHKLYESDLKDRLAALEGQRKKILLIYVVAILLILSPFVIFFLTPLGDNKSLQNAFPLFLIPALGGFGLIFWARMLQKKYRSEYKQKVVKQIVHAIDPEWTYQADGRISEMEYRESNIFRTRYDRYRGDDLISGQIDKTDFRSSELHTEYKTYEKDDDGNTKEEWHTIFKGLFFHADFNKNFSGKTYVQPDTFEKFLGKFGQNWAKIGGEASLVKLENPEFEKLFKVYSTDQNEARYILTPAIMEALVRIRKEYKRSMNLSFIGSRVYCTFFSNKDLFEPRILKSGVNFKDIEEMHHLFMVNYTIVSELNLNTRIWTKD